MEQLQRAYAIMNRLVPYLVISASLSIPILATLLLQDGRTRYKQWRGWPRAVLCHPHSLSCQANERPSPIIFPLLLKNGQGYVHIMSAKFSAFWTPVPICHCHTHATYQYSRLLLGYPLQVRTSYVQAPERRRRSRGAQSSLPRSPPLRPLWLLWRGRGRARVREEGTWKGGATYEKFMPTERNNQAANARGTEARAFLNGD